MRGLRNFFMLVGAVAAAAAAFALGRVTADENGTEGRRGADSRVETVPDGRIFTARFADTLRVPSAALYCVVSGEAGVENLLLCTHTGPDPTYQVVFDPESTLVYRIGGDGPVFSGKEE